MGNLGKITTYLKENDISLESLTPTMVHNILSDNTNITINEMVELSDTELENLEKLDNGRYNPITKRGDKVMVLKFINRDGHKTFMRHSGEFVDDFELTSELGFTELEVVTSHS